MAELGSMLVSGLMAAFLSLAGKLLTKPFFERVISKTFIALARQVTDHTKTRLDDQIVEDMAHTLGVDPRRPITGKGAP